MFAYQTQNRGQMDRFQTLSRWAYDTKNAWNIPFYWQHTKPRKGHTVDKYRDQNWIFEVLYNLPTTTKERDKIKEKGPKLADYESYFHRILYWPIFFEYQSC